jgi:hypothetical protein
MKNLILIEMLKKLIIFIPNNPLEIYQTQKKKFNLLLEIGHSFLIMRMNRIFKKLFINQIKRLKLLLFKNQWINQSFLKEVRNTYK